MFTHVTLCIILAIVTRANATQHKTKEYKSLSNVDIVILMDNSASIGVDDMAAARHFLTNLTEELFKIVREQQTWDSEDYKRKEGPLRIGIVKFDTTAEQVLQLTPATNETEIRNKINTLKSREGKWTCINEGMKLAKSELFTREKTNRTRIIFLLSDGKSDCQDKNGFRVNDDVNWTKPPNTTLFSIGVGLKDKQHKDKLQKVSKNVLEVKDFDKLDTVIEKLVKKVTLSLNNCTVKFHPVSSCRHKPNTGNTAKSECRMKYVSKFEHKKDSRLKHDGKKCQAGKIMYKQCNCTTTNKPIKHITTGRTTTATTTTMTTIASTATITTIVAQSTDNKIQTTDAQLQTTHISERFTHATTNETATNNQGILNQNLKQGEATDDASDSGFPLWIVGVFATVLLLLLLLPMLAILAVRRRRKAKEILQKKTEKGSGPKGTVQKSMCIQPSFQSLTSMMSSLKNPPPNKIPFKGTQSRTVQPEGSLMTIRSKSISKLQSGMGKLNKPKDKSKLTSKLGKADASKLAKGKR